MNLLQRRALIAVASSLGVLLLFALLAGHWVLQVHLRAAEAIEQIEPRYARLLGLRDAGSQLEDSVKQARAVLARLGYPADRDPAQVGNDLQQTARRALQAAGLTVASSQVLSPRAETGFDRVAVSLQAEGALAGVQLALAALQAESPAIAVDGLTLQATGRTAEDGSPVVSCRLTVAVLRLQS